MSNKLNKNQQEPISFKRASQLPELCYALNEHGKVGKRIVLIKRGVSGHYPFQGADGDKDTPIGLLKHCVLEFNTKLDVTPAQMEAMIIGSVFGWNVSGADPTNEHNIDAGEKFVKEAQQQTWDQ